MTLKNSANEQKKSLNEQKKFKWTKKIVEMSKK